MTQEEHAKLVDSQTKFEELFKSSTPEQRMSKQFIESAVIKNIVDSFVQ